MKQRLWGMLTILCLLLLCSTSFAQTYTVGIVPQQSAKKLAQMWQPLFDYLKDETGLTFVFSTAKDIPTFEERLHSQSYDFAYVNPFHYTVFHDSANYEALAKQANKKISGIIVVRKDSPITHIEQLNGETLAFPAPAAFAASIIPRAEMVHAGISITPQYVLSHDSVYLNVIRGFFVAGGGIVRTLNGLPEAERSQLRVLWKSKGFTPHAFVSHERIPQAHRQAVLDALLALNNTPSGNAILASIQFNGIAPAKNADWNDVRALGITSLARPEY